MLHRDLMKFVNFYMLRIFLFILLTTSLFAREYIAIIDFEGIGVSEGEARALTQRLTSEIISLEMYQIVERSEMKRLLDEQKFQYSGCVDITCAVDIGKLIGAKYMVVGSISKLGNAFSLDSRMISVETGESYISATYTVEGKIEKIIKYGMKSLAYQLCELEPPKISPITKLTDTLYNNRYIIGGVSLVIWMAWGMNWIVL